MIIDKMDPPPRYTPKPSAGSLISILPPHLLLQIVYRTFPPIHFPDPDLATQEQQRKALYWLSTNLRLVNRAFYIGLSSPLAHTFISHMLPRSSFYARVAVHLLASLLLSCPPSIYIRSFPRGERFFTRSSTLVCPRIKRKSTERSRRSSPFHPTRIYHP